MALPYKLERSGCLQITSERFLCPLGIYIKQVIIEISLMSNWVYYEILANDSKSVYLMAQEALRREFAKSAD